MWLGSEVMFFAGLFADLLHASQLLARAVGRADREAQRPLRPGQHADPGARRRSPASSASSRPSACSRAAAGGPLQFWKWGVVEWMYLTFAMGAIFVVGQVFEYGQLVSEHVAFTSDSYGSVFYLTTGFHALHVTGGLIAFLLLLGRVFAVKTLHPPRGGHRDLGLVLLALRRRGLDRPVPRHLRPQVADRIPTQLMALHLRRTPHRAEPHRSPFPVRLGRCCCSSACSPPAAATRSSRPARRPRPPPRSTRSSTRARSSSRRTAPAATDWAPRAPTRARASTASAPHPSTSRSARVACRGRLRSAGRAEAGPVHRRAGRGSRRLRRLARPRPRHPG